MNPLTLKIISAEGTLLSATADSVTLPGEDGSFGILKGHLPIIAMLRDGTVRYKKDGEQLSFNIDGGIADINLDTITIITDPETIG